jgi:hypothetical protein
MSGHRSYLNFLFRFSVQFAAVVDGTHTLDFHLIPAVHSLNPSSQPNAYEVHPRTTLSVEITDSSMNTSPVANCWLLGSQSDVKWYVSALIRAVQMRKVTDGRYQPEIDLRVLW